MLLDRKWQLAVGCRLIQDLPQTTSWLRHQWPRAN
ncbi:hypothetical protein D018_0385A, partial [Vibrio parahaemolyticus VP2007-007]